MSLTDGVRRPMLKEPRRSAKMIVTDFVNRAIRIIDDPNVPKAISDNLKAQMVAYRDVAKAMGWVELERRIARVTDHRP